jgi:hypothetical protein
MSTSEKTPASIRQGGPGSSQQNAKAPLDLRKPGSDDTDTRARSEVCGGGGEKDSHHTHAAKSKGGGSHKAH